MTVNHVHRELLRNEWMVDNADSVLAVWNGRPGRAKNSVEYAKGKPVLVIDTVEKDERWVVG